MSYTGPRKVTYLFIDGGYLRKVLDGISLKFFKGAALDTRFEQLSRGFTKCFYYDCLAPQKKDELPKDYAERCESLRNRFNNLRMIDGWHVFEGALVGSGRNARQKQVDIQIAVDMMTHTHRRNMHEIDFIAGDQDFKPLVDTLVREGMYVRLWYEKASVSPELRMAADARKVLDVYQIHSLQSEAFQNQWRLPNRTTETNRPDRDCTLIAEARLKNGSAELWLMENRLTYAFVQDDLLNPGRVLYVRHHDLEYLKLVCDSLYGPCEWNTLNDSPPALASIDS